MRTLRRVLAISVLLLAAAALPAGLGVAADDKTIDRSISVSGTGSVVVVPDIAHISAGVVSEAETARKALVRNTSVMAKLIDGLKAAGISPKDIQTDTVNVEPSYTQPKDGRPPTLSGYRVVNQVRITVRNVGELGEILDQAIALGANQMNRIAFGVSNAEALKDEARKLAVANARRHAELYATAAGVQLGQVLRIVEAGAETQRPMAGVFFKTGVPVEPGSQLLTVEVSIAYALQ